MEGNSSIVPFSTLRDEDVSWVTMTTFDPMTSVTIAAIEVLSPEKPLQNLQEEIDNVVEFYIKPVIYCIGIPGNILSLLLWLQPRLRNSSACYFAALSISDTFVLLLHMIATLEKAGITDFLVTNFLCEMFNVLYVSTECLSLMLVLGLTVDRFIIVCYPMKRHRLCTIHRTLRVLAGQTLLALIMGIVEGSFWTYSRSHHRCEPNNIVGNPVIVEIGNLVILTMGVIVPAILVIIFNIIIIMTVQKMNKRRQALCHTSRSMSIDTDATIMLLSISCYVILAEVPDEIAYLIRPFYPEGNSTISPILREEDPTWQSYYKFNITSSILSTFSLTNYAVDIFIYSLTGRRFREMVLMILRCHIFRKDALRQFRRADSISWSFKSPLRVNQESVLKNQIKMQSMDRFQDKFSDHHEHAETFV